VSFPDFTTRLSASLSFSFISMNSTQCLYKEKGSENS